MNLLGVLLNELIKPEYWSVLLLGIVVNVSLITLSDILGDFWKVTVPDQKMSKVKSPHLVQQDENLME
jgi:hypothetical protein